MKRKLDEGQQSKVKVQRTDGLYTEKSELRIILVGKIGAGKSASGNTILGEKKFVSSLKEKSVTKACRKQKVKRNGRDVVLVDTPGILDTDLPAETVAKEIGRCVAISSPGPHAILLVLRPGRYTEEDRKTVEKLLDIFGKQVMKYMIVLFTHRDDLDYEGITIENYVRNYEDKCLQELIEMCRNRYHAFNNRASEDDKEKQVSELIAMIDQMVEENGGTCYINEIHIQAEEMIKKKEDELLQNYNEELEREKLKLQQSRKKMERYQQEAAEAERQQQQTEDKMKEQKKETKILQQKIEELEKQKKELEKQVEELSAERCRNDAQDSTGGVIWKLMSFLRRKQRN